MTDVPPTKELPPIDGKYPALAREVRRLLKWDLPKDQRLSVRVGARKTELSHATIANMARGDRPSMGLVIQFAQGMGADVNLLLQSAEYPPLFAKGLDDPLSRIGMNVTREVVGLPLASGLKASAGEQGRLLGGDNPRETLGGLFPDGSEAIRIDGDCLEPFVRHGDIAIVRPQNTAQSGQTVIALLDDDTLTCKIYREEEGYFPYLEAISEDWPLIGTGFSVIGVVIKVMRDV